MNTPSPEGREVENIASPEQALASFEQYVLGSVNLSADQLQQVQYLIYRRNGNDPAVIEVDIKDRTVIVDVTGSSLLDDDIEPVRLYVMQMGDLLMVTPGSQQHICDEYERVQFASELTKRSEYFDVTIELGYRFVAPPQNAGGDAIPQV